MQPEAEEESKEDPTPQEEETKLVIKNREVFRRYYIRGVEWGIQQEGKDFKINLARDDKYIVKITIDDKCYNSR